MNDFIAERVKLVREMAERADPFTKVRLLKLAEIYDERLGRAPKARLKVPMAYPLISNRSER